MRVLIVDDDPVTRLVVRAAVARLGHVCVEAADGSDAWGRFEKVQPDVVVTDWKMPNLNGTELTRRIRERSLDGYTYVIVLTGEADEQAARGAMLAGADDLLEKPLDRVELERQLICARRVLEVHRRLRLDARLDPLTSVGNRRRLMEDLQVLLKRAERHPLQLAVMMVDLDHFKQYNDAHGHLVGDDALRRVAGAMMAALRGGDTIYRFGGEEFLAVLPEQDAASALAAARRLIRSVRALKIPHPSGGALTVSAGIAQLTEGDSVSQLIGRADRALYAAKAAGRNRARIDDGSPLAAGAGVLEAQG